MAGTARKRITALGYVRRLLKSAFDLTAWGQDVATMTTRTGRVVALPGTAQDWSHFAGEYWTIPAAQACLTWFWNNSCQAPPVVQAKGADGKWVNIEDHALADLMRTPNEAYDGTCLQMAQALSWFLDGNAYCAIDRDKSKDPSGLWWLPHSAVKARREKGSKRLIDYYEYRIGGNKQRIEVEDMLHLRYGLDPRDPRYGLAALAAADRAGATLQAAANYAGNIMLHAGAIGGLATPESESDTLDPEQFSQLWKDKHQGDGVGEMMAYNIPIKLQFPNNSPQNLALDTLPDRPEAEMCALFHLPPQVVGLHVGRLSKTYANYAEAREAAWEECVVPTQIIWGGQIGAKLLPQFGRDPMRERLAYDISNIRPLQPDKDKEHERVREDYKAGMIDRFTAKSLLGYATEPADKGTYAEKKPDMPGDGEKKPVASGNGTGAKKSEVTV